MACINQSSFYDDYYNSDFIESMIVSCQIII